MSPPDWVTALAELEAYAKERGWAWASEGHGALIVRLIEENRQKHGFAIDAERLKVAYGQTRLIRREERDEEDFWAAVAHQYEEAS